MGIDQYKAGVRKRREERLRLLSKKKKYMTPNTPGSKRTENELQSHEPMLSEQNERSAPKGSLFFLKLVCAFLLVVGVYMIMDSDHDQLEGAQVFIHDVMHRDFNMTGVMQWYEETVGARPAFLPEVIKREEGDVPGDNYIVPVASGTVGTTFGQGGQGIMIETAAQVPVEVVKEGWVIFVGEQEGYGLTVKVDHGAEEQSWYSYLQDIDVQPYDWVDQGDVVGSTSFDDSTQEGKFYFVLKRDERFVNPLEVIAFD